MNTVNLGNLVSIQTGKLDANASSPDGAYPFFTCAREPLKIANWKYDLDAILIAGNGDLNVKQYKGKFDAYQRTYILAPKDESKVHTRYIYYFLDKYLDRLREQSIGGIIKYIKLGMLSDAPIPLPPLDEQKRIAAILDQADDLRRKRKRSIDRLKQLGQAIFYEMFGDAVTNTMGWKTVQLGDIVRPGDKINYGVVQPGEEVEKGVPLVRVGDLLSGYIDSRKIKQINTSIEARYKRSRLAGDEILIGCVGSIGAVALAHEGLRGANIARAVARVPVDPDIAMRDFIAEQVKSPLVQRYFTAETRTVAQPTLNIGLIVSAPIILPPMPEQKKFAEIIEASRGALKHLIEHADKGEALFSSLQNRAFQGAL
jgi:type I restriction enzyme S subunit